MLCQRCKAGHDVQVPHLQTGRKLRRALRSLRLRHGTPPELRVYHPRPVPLQIQRQQMDAEAFSMQGQTTQYLRTAFRLIYEAF